MGGTELSLLDLDAPRSIIPIIFGMGLSTTAHNRWGMDGWLADDGEELSARCVNRDEGGLPPGPDPGPDVDNPDGLPVGTTFRVVVYEAGADPQSASPVDQNTYKIADADGTIVAAAVDERGNATADAARELVLRRGAYDFYYFSPAVSANTALPNPGTYTGLANGADYMALAHRETIDPSKGSKHYIPEVCFYRMGSYIDVRIRPRAGEVVRTLEVTGDGLQLWGLPASGRYEIGDYPYRLITEGRGGMVEFAASDFAAEEGTTATASTLGVGGGRAVLPGYAGELQVKVTLTSDGKEMKLDASLAGHNFAAGATAMSWSWALVASPTTPNWTSRSFRGTNTTGATAVSAGEDISRSTRAAARCSNPNWSSRVHGSGLSTTAGARATTGVCPRRTSCIITGASNPACAYSTRLWRRITGRRRQCVECGSGMDVRFRLRHSE